MIKFKRMAGCLVIALLFPMVLAACGGNGADSSGQGNDSKVYTVKIAYENNPGEPLDVAAREWKKLAEEKSGGRLKLELYPSSQLGSKMDVIEQMKSGSNVITHADASFLMDYVPDFGILSAPYLTENYDQLLKLTKSDWFKDMEKQLQAKGLHIVTTNWIYGTRHLITNKQVTKPEDLQGMKIRVPNNQLFIKTMEEMGATPTPMPLGEVYTALSQGVVDGAENPLPVIVGSKTYEQAKYLALTGHIHMISQWIAGQQFIESLPEDIRNILKETADQAGEYMNKLVADADKDAINEMKAAGVKVNEVDQQAFREAVKDIYNQFPEWSPGLYDKIQQILQQ